MHKTNLKPKKNWKQYDNLSTLHIQKLKSGYKNIILHGQYNVYSYFLVIYLSY